MYVYFVLKLQRSERGKVQERKNKMILAPRASSIDDICLAYLEYTRAGMVIYIDCICSEKCVEVYSKINMT